jgi:hypothetical protein
VAGSSWDLPETRGRNGLRSRVSLWIGEKYSNPHVAAWTGVAVLWVLLLAGALPTVLAHMAPSGADPGNWLDLAWSLTGQGVHLTAWAYPPLTFMILRGLLALLQPLTAVKVLGLAAWGALATAMWLTLNRSLPRLLWPIRLAIAALCSFPGYTAEMYSWGGYPQIIGMAFLIVAIPALEETLLTGRRQAAALAMAANLGVIFTHHLLAITLPIFWLIVFGWVFGHARETRRMIWSRFWKVAAITGGLGLLALPIYLKYVSLLAGNPANASGFNAQNIPALIQYVFRELAPLWLALLVLGFVTPFVLPRSRLSGSAAALIWGTLILFAFLWEVRLLQILFTGIAFGLGSLFEEAWSYPSNPRFARLRQGLLAGCLVLALLAGLNQGHALFLQATTYYRVMDDAIIPGTDWLSSHVPSGERVAVSQTRPDLLGWWIAGLARRPTLAATDPRWLSFTAERYYANIANQIFNAHTPPETITRLLYENDIHWVFIDKTNEPFDLSPLIGNGVLTGAFETQRVLILKVNRVSMPASSLSGAAEPQ